MNFTVFYRILLARKWILLAAMAIVVLTTLVVSLWLPKRYSAEASITIDTKASDPITGQPIAGYLTPSFMMTQVDIIGSQAVGLKVVEILDLANVDSVREQWLTETGGRGDVRTWLADSMHKNLDVQPSRESNVINLTYSGVDPKFAAVVANAFVQAYIQTITDIKVAAAQQNNQFFEQQLKVLQSNLEKAQKELSEYQQAEGIVATDERLDIETQKLNELNSQMVTAQSMALDAKSRTRGGEQAPDVLNNPLIQQLKNSISVKEAQLQELAQKSGPNHPHYLQTKAELDATRNQLAQLTRQYAGGLDSAAGNAASRQASLAAATRQQKERVLDLKSQRSKLEVLQRGVDNAQRVYDQALQRYSQTALESRANQANVAVLKTAVEPSRHSFPKINLNLILAVFVGGILGLGFALLAEMLDRRVRSRADIENLLSIPVLAEIEAERKGGWFFRRKLLA